MKLLLVVHQTMRSTPNNEESNTIYSICIAFKEVKKFEVMQRDVFCVHKHGFLMLGHK